MSITFPRRGRPLAAGQRSELTIIDLDGNNDVVFTADEVIEAPNWSPDGHTLVFNAGGRLFRIPAAGGTVEAVDTGHLADLNNDHVLSPDGSTIYVSSDDGHLYAVPFAGGRPRRVSNTHDTPFHYYLDAHLCRHRAAQWRKASERLFHSRGRWPRYPPHRSHRAQ